MKIITHLFITLLFFLLSGCNGQSIPEKTQPSPDAKELVGGPFENGEFMYYGMPSAISSIDTSAGWNQDGQKLLITGTIFKGDGKTPAPHVILYYYHTDTDGHYSTKKGLDKRVVRHGYIRGWVQSDEAGHYEIYTVRPAPYPNSQEPAHIHPSIKEPHIEKEYYLDAFVFDDDRSLTGSKRKAMKNRGGSGVLRILQIGDLQVAEHNIILGLHIPNYPEAGKSAITSGREIGEDIISFTPHHAWGPDQGTQTCPICKYGRYHGILYFVGNHPDWDDIKKWLAFLEAESIRRKKYLKVYFVYGNENEFDATLRETELAQVGKELGLTKTALTFVPSFHDKKSEINFANINPEVENTFLIYRQSNVIEKFVDLKATSSNFELISSRLTETTNDFFELATPGRDKD